MLGHLHPGATMISVELPQPPSHVHLSRGVWHNHDRRDGQSTVTKSQMPGNLDFGEISLIMEGSRSSYKITDLSGNSTSHQHIQGVEPLAVDEANGIHAGRYALRRPVNRTVSPVNATDMLGNSVLLLDPAHVLGHVYVLCLHRVDCIYKPIQVVKWQ